MNPTLYKDNGGNSYSAYPPTTYLTFAYWIYCVPQYRPESVLILGYAGGTIAGLIRLLYGDVPITGVDLDPHEDRYGATIIKADAREYVKTCGHFDCVIVDVFSRDRSICCDFITDSDFVADLARIGNYLIINTLGNPDMSAYKGLRMMGRNKPSGSAEQIYYYEVKKIPHLHPYK
jgi:hypothetical protein